MREQPRTAEQGEEGGKDWGLTTRRQKIIWVGRAREGGGGRRAVPQAGGCGGRETAAAEGAGGGSHQPGPPTAPGTPTEWWARPARLLQSFATSQSAASREMGQKSCSAGRVGGAK